MKEKKKKKLEQNEELEEQNVSNDELEDYKNKWLRAQADYQNLQKEIREKRSEWIKMSEVQVVEEFLPVFDNFKKAFFHKENLEENKNWENWALGIGFIMKQFEDILKRCGITEIETVGKEFDPVIHDAVGEEESEEYGEGVVAKEMESGYRVKDKILKPAKVIVSLGKINK